MMICVYNAGTGDMAELVECARLEIAYTGNCIEGSNPPISARNLPRRNAGKFYGGDMGVDEAAATIGCWVRNKRTKCAQ